MHLQLNSQKESIYYNFNVKKNNMNKYQGDDIPIVIQLEPQSDTDKQTIENFTRIIVLAYTDPCFISKFAYPAQDGFHTLHRQKDNETSLFGIIPSADTKKMHGNIIVELMFESESKSEIGDEKNNSSKKINTGISILKTQIKNKI